jgi:hypothetical protein
MHEMILNERGRLSVWARFRKRKEKAGAEHGVRPYLWEGVTKYAGKIRI